MTLGSRALRLEITRIKLYERNPRRSKNPEYDRIKASILKSGMDQRPTSHATAGQQGLHSTGRR